MSPHTDQKAPEIRQLLSMNGTAAMSLGRRSERRAGFTLMELLVAIGICVVLASLLAPAGFRGLESARVAKCTGNLKQIAAAALQYSADNDGRLIPMSQGTAAEPVTFRVLLLPYLEDNRMKVFICPSDPWANKMLISAYTREKGTQPTSYAINATYYSNVNGVALPFPGTHDYLTSVTGKKLSSIPHPSATIFLCDTGRPDSVGGNLRDWTEKRRSISNANFGQAAMPYRWNAGDDCIYPRHAGARTNVAFYDGHVATLDLQKDVVEHSLGDPLCLYDFH